MKLIKQGKKYNCGIACMAMLCGTTIAEAERFFERDCCEHIDNPSPDMTGHHFIGLTLEEMEAAFFSINISTLLWYPPEAYGESVMNLHRDKLPSVPTRRDVFEHFCQGSGIVSVPSLNMEGCGHYIAVHDGKIYDPSNGPKTYNWPEDPKEMPDGMVEQKDIAAAVLIAPMYRAMDRSKL